MPFGYPDPSEKSPEEDPEGYAEYLRRKVVATARAYCRRSYEGRQFVKNVEDSYPLDAVRQEGIEGWIAEFRALCQAIENLDDWKEEFALKDID